MVAAGDGAKEYVAGFSAGVATVITGHPFDTVKVKGLYRGASSSFIGMAFESSLVFGIYAQTKQFLQFWAAVLPLDVAKTIIQTAPDPNLSRNPFQTLSSIYSRVGLRGCYAGLGPTSVRAFPVNAVAIVTWEFTAKLLGIKRD